MSTNELFIEEEPYDDKDDVCPNCGFSYSHFIEVDGGYECPNCGNFYEIDQDYKDSDCSKDCETCDCCNKEGE